MTPLLEHLSAPWAVGLFVLLLALLAMAFLRALRRRRALVSGLAVFVRTRTQNLPPAPPPRFLDRQFFLKALLLALLVMIIAGIAVQSQAARPRRIAILIDNGPAGQFLRIDGQPLISALGVAAADLERTLKTDDGVHVEIISAVPSVTAAPASQPVDITAVLQTLCSSTSKSQGTATAWDEIHIFSPRPPPADAPTSIATRILWHTPAFQLSANAGIVRFWIEPQLPGANATVQPAAPAADNSSITGVARWSLWLDIAGSVSPPQTLAVQLSTSADGKSWTPAFDPRAPAALVALEGGLVGPLELPEGSFTALAASLVDLSAAPTGAPAAPVRDALPLDDKIVLHRAPIAPLTAIVDPAADSPMLKAALAAWQISIEDPAVNPQGETKRPGPRLFLCDGSPEALARLEKLRPAPGSPAATSAPILPVFIAPAADLPGLQFEPDPPKIAESTSVPSGNPAYALLGRQSWRIAALRNAKLTFGGTVVVQSPVGPAIVRWIDPQGRPAWAILFDPAQSTLANRHTAAWLALWDQIAVDARSLTGDGAGSAAGWVWSGPNYPFPQTNPLDRRITTLASSPGRETVLSEGMAASTNPATGVSAAPTTPSAAQTWSLSAAAAVLALLVLFWILTATRRPA